MKLYEFDHHQVSTGYYDPNRDEINQRRLDDTRKPLLTLAIVNRLKRMRALKKLEALKRQDIISVMYSGPEGDSGGLGF